MEKIISLYYQRPGSRELGYLHQWVPAYLNTDKYHIFFNCKLFV